MTDKQQMEEVLEEPLTLTLTLEDGKELNCEVLATLELNDKEYIAVLPENEEEFWIYEYAENEDGTLSINNIEDDDIFDQVGEAFEEMFDEDDDVDAMIEKDDEEDEEEHKCNCNCDDDDCDDDDCDCDDDDCDCNCDELDKE